VSDIHCFYVSEGLLAPIHLKRIGPSLWEFLWLISHETRMEGKVLNGSAITISRIATELGESVTTAKRNLSRLSREGYVVRKRETAGKTYSYAIAHSKKWKIHWEGGGKTGLTSGVESGLTQAPGQGENGLGVRSETPPGQVISGTTNKDIDKLDKIDIRAKTVCRKCGGTGLVRRMVPSDLIPGTDKYDWVKCNECQ
jgi:hypothetical protein